MSSKQDEEIKINGFLGEGDKLTSYLLGQEGHKQKQQPSGDWYHASFHTLTTVVGAGVLGLPWAFSYLSSFYAILFLFGSLSFSLYTGYQLAYMHEDEDGSRHNSYIALGQRVLGRRKGNWGVLPFQYSILLGSAITYIIMCGTSVSHIMTILAEDNNWSFRVSLEWGIVIFGASQLLLSHVKDFHSLWFVSFVGSILAIGYCCIACVLSTFTIIKNNQNGKTINFGLNPEDTDQDRYYSILNSVGTIIFAFCAHSILLETQATLKKAPSTRKEMMKAISTAYVLSLFVYVCVGVLGYAAFGTQVNGNILVSTTEPKWLVLLANIMVVTHMVGANLLNYMPVFDNIETSLNLNRAEFGTLKWGLKSVIRSLIVGVTILVALFVPFFSAFNGLVGAIGGAYMNFILPPILWLLHHKVGAIEKMVNIGLILIGVLVALGSLAGAARNLVVETIDYHT
eukprot:TRINITY_DN7005_c0_g1_i5.p1 TRINITY_DN7005_c0_g1~~TRINITY_DN7005_c0_g1_i5.p1  ORF type:complete len:479 (-),score=27.07 TRINITY_DN7005_c0_g1_i5:4-1368(-)